MRLAIMVSTRLWIAGEVSRTRDTKLANRVLHQGRCCSQAACSLLICTDGWSVYPERIKSAFRDKEINVSSASVKLIKQPAERLDRDAGPVFCLDGCRQEAQPSNERQH